MRPPGGRQRLGAAACALQLSLAALLPAAQAQEKVPQPSAQPRVGVLADPCLEDPDTWRGNPDAWRELDWGQRCRYWRENTRLVAAGTARVVFIGDSITEAWGQADPQLFTHGILNRGIGGQTSDQMRVRFRSDVIDLEPRVVHIMAGTNDVAGNTGPTSLAFVQGNIRSMVEEALLHHIRVVIAAIPPAAHIPWRGEIERPDLTIAAMGEWLRAYARCQHVEFVDYGAVLGDGRGGIKPGLSFDGLHPTPAGYALMTPVARAAVARALSQPAPAKPRIGCGK